jgi:hypothetical protein
MSGTGFCSSEVTLPLSVAGIVLLVISEILGFQEDKSDKCTSVIQYMIASCLWLYYKIRDSCRKKTEEEEDEAVKAFKFVARNLTFSIGRKQGQRLSNNVSFQQV